MMSAKFISILKKPWASIVIAIFFGFFIAALLLAFSGYNPIDSVIAIFNGMFSKPRYFANIFIKSTPIILTGISVAFGFKTGLFNIGAEGQFILGSVAAVFVGMNLDPGLPKVLAVFIVLCAGIIAGAFMGAIVGALRSRYGIHEVMTSIMLNWVAFYFSNFFVSLEKFHKPNTNGTYQIKKNAYTTLFSNTQKNSNKFLNEILNTDFNIGILVAILVAILITFFLYKTEKGFELRAVGLNARAAELAGIGVRRNIFLSMVIQGAICGLAAALFVTGAEPHNISTISAFENYGFNGLAVALIAKNSAIGCLFSGLLFGGLIYGGRALQYEVGAPTEIINVIIGSIVFFVAINNLLHMIVLSYKRRRNQDGISK